MEGGKALLGRVPGSGPARKVPGSGPAPARKGPLARLVWTRSPFHIVVMMTIIIVVR